MLRPHGHSGPTLHFGSFQSVRLPLQNIPLHVLAGDAFKGPYGSVSFSLEPLFSFIRRISIEEKAGKNQAFPKMPSSFSVILWGLVLSDIVLFAVFFLNSKLISHSVLSNSYPHSILF